MDIKTLFYPLFVPPSSDLTFLFKSYAFYCLISSEHEKLAHLLSFNPSFFSINDESKSSTASLSREIMHRSNVF